MPDTRYLKRRKGKQRSGERWHVCIRIPKDLQGRFSRRKTIERALKTGDLREAQKRRYPVVAEILETFERARNGGLSSLDIEAEVQRHMRELLERLQSRPQDVFKPVRGPNGEDYGLGGDAALHELLVDLNNEDWSPVELDAEKIIRRRGVTLSEEQHDELCRALQTAKFEGLDAALKLHRGEVPERPAALNPKAVDPVTLELPCHKAVMPRSGKAPSVSEAAERYVKGRMCKLDEADRGSISNKLSPLCGPRAERSTRHGEARRCGQLSHPAVSLGSELRSIPQEQGAHAGSAIGTVSWRSGTIQHHAEPPIGASPLVA